MPVIEQGLLGHDDLLDFDGSLLKGVSGGSGFFLLRDELGLVEGLLLVESLDLFVHGVNEHILSLLLLLKVDHRLFSSVSCPSCNGNLRFHHFIVLFDLLQGSVELIELLLGFKDSLKLIVGLFLLVLVLLLEEFVLLLGLDPVSLDDVEVVVSALELGLHLGQLVLHAVQLHTSLFSLLLDLPDFLFFLSELQIHALVLVCQLLGKSVLQTGHQRLDS